MKIKHIDHIGIAVKSLEKASEFYTKFLGCETGGKETVPDQKATVSFFPFKDTTIELLEATDPDGPIAKFIDSKGEGIHHIAFRVENIEEWPSGIEGQRGSSHRSTTQDRGQRH